jgi:hypothetical protein
LGAGEGIEGVAARQEGGVEPAHERGRHWPAVPTVSPAEPTPT